MLIQSSYHEVLAAVVAKKASLVQGFAPSLLITGTPGLGQSSHRLLADSHLKISGKTSLLWYILAHALSRRETAAFLFDENLFVYTPEGVYHLTDRRTWLILNTYLAKNILFCIDMDWEEAPLPWRTVQNPNQCFCVAAASPRESRYKFWVNKGKVVHKLVLSISELGDYEAM